MDTDEHGYQAIARASEFVRKVHPGPGQKSVCIRVHPWLMIPSPVFKGGA